MLSILRLGGGVMSVLSSDGRGRGKDTLVLSISRGGGEKRLVLSSDKGVKGKRFKARGEAICITPFCMNVVKHF